MRRKAKQRRIMIGAAATVVAIAAGSTLIYWNLPGTKAQRKVNKGLEYMTAMDYVHAEEAYSDAISLDETSERAYRGLADDYLAQGRQEEAEAMLRQGYEATGSEVLLQNYCATVLNRVVDQIREGTAGFDAVEDCLDVLEKMPGDEAAQEVLSACGSAVMVQDESSMVMLDQMDGTETFGRYASVMDRMLGMEVDAAVLSEFVIPGAQDIYLSLSHADAYREILSRAQQYGVAEAGELLACLDKQAQISAFFAPVFVEFEARNFEAAKEFIVSEEYIAVRDAFIDQTMEYWEGGTYVPVTKEAIRFHRAQEGWKFSYVEDDGRAKPTGTIRVLGQKMLDLGVQRSSIEYVPGYEPGEYYPHTEYEIVYWNTMVSGIATDNTNVVSRMNYRFAEKIYTAAGMEANMIYDWGGANEKRQKE